MVSEIRKISGNNVYLYNQPSVKKSQAEYSNISMTSTDSLIIQDKSSDGKFSTSEALKNFGKGLVSPITGMFSSPKNFIIGAGMIAGSALLIAATGGAAAPVLVAAGVATGALQAGKAVYKIATAQNGDDVEKAFYDVGGATSTIGLSVAGAKASLKQANIDTKGLNVIGATKKCFTSAKDLSIESFNVFKSGYFKTNISNALKTSKTPKELKKYSKEIFEETKQNFDESFASLKNALPDEFKPALKGRGKSQISILEKLIKETNKIDSEIKKINSNPDLPQEAKQLQIEEFLTDKFKKVDNFDIKALRENNYNINSNPKLVKSLVEDGYGARLTLENTSGKKINNLVEALADAVKRGDIEITEIENYRGFNPKYKKGNVPYFKEDQVQILHDISMEKGTEVRLASGNKVSGYTSVQLKVKPRNGKVMELQIRGKEVNKVAEVEHIPYDLKQGKDISKGSNQIGMLTAKIKKAITELTPDQLEQYRQYNYDNYVYAQAKELGKHAKKPSLPEGINTDLSIENLELLNEKAHIFPPGRVKKPFVYKPQIGLISSIESRNAD